jgi:hypothetical protein
MSKTRRAGFVSHPLPLIDLEFGLTTSVGFLGPTSTWSYCRRALALVEHYVPQTTSPPDPLNLDGAAFTLRWTTKSNVDQEDLANLPPLDYAQYMLSTVKFHLGELFQIVDETHFVHHLKMFYQNPLQTAQQYRLWFVEFLLVLAFGKAFLVQSGPSSFAPPGSEHGTRALALIPNLQQLHEGHILSIEVLALAAIYCQSVDIRVAAFQYASS